MVTTLFALTLSCMPYPMMPPPAPRVTSSCEGPDLVTRDHDRREVTRRPNGCMVTSCEGADVVTRDRSGVEHRRLRFSASCVTSRCEGSDLVRRDDSGVTYSRQSYASACISSRCEGTDFVQRDSRGLELNRLSASGRCGAPAVRLTQNDAWRYGLTAR